MNTPECPHCHNTLIWEDDVDTTYSDDDYYIVTVRGSCPICKKVFLWDEYYKYSHRNNLIEDDRY